MKKRESLINGMGKIDDSILERYDKIDADIDERKTKLPRKRRIGAISLIASAAAILLAVTPFAVKKLGLFSYFPLGQVTGSTPAEGSTPESIPDNPPIETEIWVDDLGYALNEDGNSYTLVGYRGEAVDIAVHETVNGLNVTHIGANAFARNEELSSVTLPDSIQVIGEYAFDGCKSLKNVNMGNGVKEIRENAFHRCTSLKEIEIPYGVVEIEQFAFFYCESLEEIVIPESVTSLGCSAFQNCSSLRRAVIPGSVKTVPTTLFQECYSLSWVTLSEGITEIGDYAFTKCSSLMTVVLPESLEKIGMGAFNECSRLSSINIPNGIAEIKGYTFSQCKRLTEIVIPDSVSIIGESAFQKCASLEGISIPDGVEKIGNSAFKGCTSLANVHLGQGVTDIGESAFAGCSALTSINFPDNVEIIRANAFENCEKLNGITLPRAIQYISAYSFMNCISLDEIYLPENIKALEKGAFSGCSSLSKVEFADNSKFGYIWDEAFKNCTSLRRITLPDEVWAIDENVFSGCSELLEVTVSVNISTIESRAFSDCPKLRYLIYKGSAEEWKKVHLGNDWNAGSDLLKVYTDGELPPTVTISYELGGGVNNANNPTSVTMYDDLILGVTNIPTHGDRVFAGWTWEGQETPVYCPVIREISEPITLCANWTFGTGEHAEIYEIYKYTPTVDGLLDVQYRYSREVTLRDHGSEYATGNIFFLWDDDALYFYIIVKDPTPQSDYNGGAEEYQCIDIMMSIANFDPTAENIPGKLADDIGDAQFRIFNDNVISDCMTVVDNGIKYADGSHGGFGKWVYENTNMSDPASGSNYMVHSYDDGGFVAEGFIKWSPELKESVIKDGLIIGIGLQYNDDIDDDGQRDRKIYSSNAGPDNMSMAGNRATCGKFVLEGEDKSPESVGKEIETVSLTDELKDELRDYLRYINAEFDIAETSVGSTINAMMSGEKAYHLEFNNTTTLYYACGYSFSKDEHEKGDFCCASTYTWIGIKNLEDIPEAYEGMTLMVVFSISESSFCENIGDSSDRSIERVEHYRITYPTEYAQLGNGLEKVSSDFIILERHLSAPSDLSVRYYCADQRYHEFFISKCVEYNRECCIRITETEYLGEFKDELEEMIIRPQYSSYGFLKVKDLAIFVNNNK